MRFIPVQFSQMLPPVPEPHAGDALHLPPAALPIQATKSLQIPDARADRDGLDLGDLAKNVEVPHPQILDPAISHASPLRISSIVSWNGETPASDNRHGRRRETLPSILTAVDHSGPQPFALALSSRESLNWEPAR